ncbi:hypothetical protein E1267_01375 [Nonomuraea longispora]|uniref:Peptidyl-prolyl cis-trans isomerase SurA n=1 Tax=Nonomuraea longispora TaxID=1848320 RepID=A0A4R4NSX3_9ACTN|nr:hypothetical protein [Nonomuraea longispora]TDC11110.1 hypothetical protein E1267_01375 [Nonomuraea longispora]
MKSIRVAAASAAAGIALTACSSPMQAGAAAVVGNERISASELNEETKAYVAAMRNVKLPPELEAALSGRSLEEAVEQEQGTPASQRVLRRMADVLMIKQVLERHNVQVSQTEIDNVLKDPGQYPSAELNLLLGPAASAPQEAQDYGMAFAGLEKLRQRFGSGQDGADRLTKELSSVKVVYSPRYGALNPQRSQQNPAMFVDNGRFGKASEPQQPQQQG